MADLIASTVRYVNQYVPIEVLLPFFLIFGVLYYFTKKVKVFEDNEKLTLIIPVILAVLTVVPHVMNKYPTKYDPILIINNAVPTVGLLAVAIVILFIILGVIGTKVGAPLRGMLTLLSVGILVYLFAASIWPSYRIFDFLRGIPRELISVIVVLLVLGLVINWIAKPPSTTGGYSPNKAVDALGSFFGKFGKDT